MKVRNIISVAILLSGLSAPVFATSPIPYHGSADVLYNNQSFNTNLETGEYDFGNMNSRYGSSFQDRWKFTVAEDSSASISIFDLEKNFRKPKKFLNTTKIFDTKYLRLSVYQRGKLIGSIRENETLDDLNLLAGKWYTIQVQGKVNGFFGSAYHGVLDVNPTPVPLGDTAPLLGSALALLALRFRKRLSSAV